MFPVPQYESYWRWSQRQPNLGKNPFARHLLYFTLNFSDLAVQWFKEFTVMEGFKKLVK